MLKAQKYFLIILVMLTGTAFNSIAQSRVTVQLTMWTTGTHTLWDGSTTTYYGFAPGFLVPPIFPGPVIYAEEGDTVTIKVRNQSQGAPHTIHLHGLDVDQANDGVPATSFEIPHLGDTQYVFIAPHPGTYLYHCHVASVIHVQMGMYGNVIIGPKGGGKFAWTNGPAYDREARWLMSEFDKSWHDNIPVHNTNDSVHAVFEIPAYEPDYFMVNGLSQSDLGGSSTAIRSKPGEKVYLRLSNIGFLMNDIIFPESMNATIISSDGRPIPSSIQKDTILLTPGERYGVMLTPLTEFSDSVVIVYRDMNNLEIIHIEKVPVFVDSTVTETAELVARNFDFSLFPNPGKAEVDIFWVVPTKKGGFLHVYDLQGKLMGDIPIAVGQRALSANFTNLASGVYIFRLEVDGRIGIRKWVKN